MHQELSLAFIWHFHQPDYRAEQGGIRLMPWARLHAIKDYLDMLKIMDKFPQLKLNFSMDPSLLDTLEDYAYGNGHDIHSKLAITPVEELSKDDKIYILNYFFDANYDNLISGNARYDELYVKRYERPDIGTEDFSDEEYSDIMFLFNFVWFDPMWRQSIPELKKFEEKQFGYTLDDRKNLIEIQRKIIRQIIPTFKKYQDEGRIEIITTAYNHPILPILAGSSEIKSHTYKHPFPEFKINLTNDAKELIKKAASRMEEAFGKRPNGIWPGELCISPKTLELFAGFGFKWTVTDERILSSSIHKEFIRDFRGCYEDPYDVCSLYKYNTKKDNNINIVFRDAVVPNLISFEYPHHKSEFCANDLFDRIKTAYDKLKNSPDASHILTIAMDGENCWENYENDGAVFLDKLYSLIENDKTIKTVLLSDYIEENKQSAKQLKKIVPGSSGDQNFRLWIAEPTKNLAWQYLIKARDVIKKAEKNGNIDKEKINLAKQEVYIAEGSDWFWWYGEPNNSGQDHIFDFLFREHLKNIYSVLGLKTPVYLDMPLTAVMGKPLKEPGRNITPIIDGYPNENKEWSSAGCIDIPDGPVLQENKLFNRIYYGQNDDNLYIRFDVNKYTVESNEVYKDPIIIYIYIKSYGESVEYASPVRIASKTNNILPVLNDGYTHEINITLNEGSKHPFRLLKAIKNGLWRLHWNHNIKYAYNKIIEIEIPFDNIGVKCGESLDFLILTGNACMTENVYPKDIPLSLRRPQIAKENPSLI